MGPAGTPATSSDSLKPARRLPIATPYPSSHRTSPLKTPGGRLCAAFNAVLVRARFHSVTPHRRHFKPARSGLTHSAHRNGRAANNADRAAHTHALSLRAVNPPTSARIRTGFAVDAYTLPVPSRMQSRVRTLTHFALILIYSFHSVRCGAYSSWSAATRCGTRPQGRTVGRGGGAEFSAAVKTAHDASAEMRDTAGEDEDADAARGGRGDLRTQQRQCRRVFVPALCSGGRARTMTRRAVYAVTCARSSSAAAESACSCSRCVQMGRVERGEARFGQDRVDASERRD
ncbi:hypothetical protein DFH09DRAFT_1302926 [Mycena vulgaris]|nr:hypothetical protein DFH09DRAFT_1302926 [Mycena vulgaris]